MTTIAISPLTTTRPAARHSTVTGRLSVPRVIVSELIKARSLPSTWWTLATTWAMALGLSILIAYMNMHYDPIQGTGLVHVVPSTMNFTLLTVPLATGCLLGGGEYASGAIRSTLASIQHRQLWFGAKTVALTLILLISSAIAALLSLGASAAVILALGGSPTLSGLELVHIGLATLTGPIVGLIGFWLAMLTRSVAGSITIGFIILLVAPMVLQSIPYEWAYTILQLLPMMSTASLANILTDSAMAASFWLTPLGGGLVCLTWVTLGLAAAAVVLQHRDA